MRCTDHQGADTQCRNCLLLVGELLQEGHYSAKTWASAAAVATAYPASEAVLGSSEPSKGSGTERDV